MMGFVRKLNNSSSKEAYQTASCKLAKLFIEWEDVSNISLPGCV